MTVRRHNLVSRLARLRTSRGIALTVLAAGLVSASFAIPTAAAAAPSTVVSITFDNAWENQMVAAADMQAAGLTGTFYVPSGWIGLTNYMTMSDLDTLQADGDEIGGKTVNNSDLEALTQSATTSGADEAEREICEGRNILLADGFDVTDFAYPFADFNASDETIVADCGFNSGRGVGNLADEHPGGCTYPDCPYAETIPPTDPYSINTPDDVETTTTLAELEGDVTNAEANGGGWLPFSFHQICDTSTAGCDPVYSWSPDLFTQFVTWLASEQAAGDITVETVQQVIGGAEQPAVTNYPTSPTAAAGTNALADSALTDGVTVTGSPNPDPTAGPVTYDVTVSEGAQSPTGSVVVSDGDGGSCTIASLSDGSGSCAITEAAALTAYTVTATYSGDSAYPSAEATLTGTTNETVGQAAPILAVAPPSPTCWTPDSYGSNSPSFSWSATGGEGGGGEETINMASVSSGDADLITSFDLGQCAPTTVVGDSYSLSVYYESTVPVFFSLYGRSSIGTWSYWTQSPTFPAASTWTLATWISPPVPSTIDALSYGMTIQNNGSLSTSDYSLTDNGVGVPPPAGPGANGLQNSLLTTADASGANPACYFQDSSGTNSPSFVWNPTGGEIGGKETIDMTSYSSGDAALLVNLDNGNCAPSVVAGDTYSVSVYYQSSVPVLFALYDRADDGTWGYWTASSSFPATGTSWSLATFISPPVPAGFNGASFGMALESVGTLATSDYGLINTGVSVPTVSVSGPAVATPGPVSYSVAVSGSGATPTGSVVVADGSGGSCTITSLTNGSGSCSINEAASSTPYSVTAEYYGDVNYATAGGTTTESVNLLTPTVTLSASPSPATTGPVTYAVAVAGPSGGPTPTGSVSVSDGAGGACSITLSAAAGNCSITEAAGSYSVAGSYSGDTNYATSTGRTNETVAEATPTVTLTGTTGAASGPVSYSVTVAGGGPAPTGSVSVSDGAGGTCSITLSAGAGSCPITENAASSPYSVTASYPGDLNYTTATGTTSEVVAKATPAVTVSGPASPPGSSVTYTVAVTGRGATPTGSVSVSDGTRTCTIAALSSGAGTCSITEPAGTYTVTATYGGDNNYATAKGTTSEAVAKGTPVVIVKGTPNPASPPGSVSYAVTVTGVASLVPTGSVKVSDGTRTCTIAALSSGAGSCAITEPAGSYTVTATYAGNTSYNAAAGTVAETVAKATPTVGVSASPNPASAPGSVTYTVTVTSASGATPTGSVKVSDGTRTCSLSLSGGGGNCKITEPAGSYAVTATYAGNTNYNAAAATTTETVDTATPTVTVTGSPNPATGPRSVTYSVSVKGVAGFTPTGSVSVSDGTLTCTIAALNGSGNGSCAISEPSGTYTVTASYAGSANYTAASGTSTETVGKAAPKVAIKGSPNPASAAGSVTYTVTVTGASGFTPTGSVTVSDGTRSCTISALGSGAGSCAISEPVGSFSVSAAYSGDPNYNPATATMSETVR